VIWAILGHIITQAGEELKGAKDEDGALAPLVASDITMGLNPILSATSSTQVDTIRPAS